jgi:enoyl-CoA hydratase
MTKKEKRMPYETILVEQRGAVTLVTLNRPQALNALNSQILADLLAAFAAFDADPGQGCAVLTGSAKAFAAGADIKEMQTQGFADMYVSDFFAGWERFTRTRKPVIAAVAGFALGGGCELAMMCDFILAADTARFGQPEIKLAVSPGMGGSQRLTRAVGKAKAMEMCLTGRMMTAEEAERAGLVSRIVPADRSRCWRTRKWSTPRSRRGSPWACSSSGGCSTRCSAPPTRAREWRRSSRSARGSGRGNSSSPSRKREGAGGWARAFGVRCRW